MAVSGKFQEELMLRSEFRILVFIFYAFYKILPFHFWFLLILQGPCKGPTSSNSDIYVMGIDFSFLTPMGECTAMYIWVRLKRQTHPASGEFTL